MELFALWHTVDLEGTEPEALDFLHVVGLHCREAFEWLGKKGREMKNMDLILATIVLTLQCLFWEYDCCNNNFYMYWTWYSFSFYCDCQMSICILLSKQRNRFFSSICFVLLFVCFLNLLPSYIGQKYINWTMRKLAQFCKSGSKWL